LFVASAVVFVTYRLTGTRQVYLLPLEAEPELMQSLKQYYRTELNLDVHILPSVQLTSAEWNEQRHQLIAEYSYERMYEKYPWYRWPTNAIVIGITSRDMYISGRPWLFAFSWRARQGAVVSYARMDNRAFGLPPNPQLLERRLRKMVTRNIGVLDFQLPMVPDPTNLMYQDIMGLEELDQIGEDLKRAGFPVAGK
jgi:predicted Zn-dependent protease